MKKWYFLIVFVILGSIFILNASSIPDKSFAESRFITRIRNIGHLILLRSGDTVSRVLPIQRLPGDAYKIVFEKAFKPVPDSIFAISSEQLNLTDKTFAIELYEQATDSLLYSFVVAKDREENILPCPSRPLPDTRYAIIIRFDKAPSPNNRNFLILGASSLLVLTIAWAFYNFRTKSIPGDANPVSSAIPIGKFQFYPNQQKLTCGEMEIALTRKETELLTLLSQSLGTVVDRQVIQKQIWEDKGVIVTRSLDIFVSRLRKKLQADETVKIMNVHGKGYKLEVVSS